ARGHDDRPRLQRDRAFLHGEIDGAVLTGRDAPGALRQLARARVDRVLHRERHLVGEIDRLRLAETQVEGIRSLDGADLDARVAGRAAVVDVARVEAHGHVEVAGLAGDPLDLGHRVEADPGVVLDPTEVDLEPAVRRTQLREVLVELRHPSAQIRVLLDDGDVVTGLGGLEGRRDAGDAAADHQDRPVDLSYGQGDLTESRG